MLILKELTGPWQICGARARELPAGWCRGTERGDSYTEGLEAADGSQSTADSQDQSCLNGPQSEAIFMTGVHGEFGNSRQGSEEIFKLKNKRAAEGCRS